MKVIVALKDKVSGLFMQPFFVPAVGVAYRTLQDEAARDKDFVVAKHPDDFALYQLGTFEEETGRLYFADKSPTLLIECGALLTKE